MEESFWQNQLPCGPVATPISCIKLKIRSAHVDSPIVAKQFFFSRLVIWVQKPVYASHIKKIGKRVFGRTSFLVGQFLKPISSTKLKIRSAQVSSLVPLHGRCRNSQYFTDQETQQWNSVSLSKINKQMFLSQ